MLSYPLTRLSLALKRDGRILSIEPQTHAFFFPSPPPLSLTPCFGAFALGTLSYALGLGLLFLLSASPRLFLGRPLCRCEWSCPGQSSPGGSFKLRPVSVSESESEDDEDSSEDSSTALGRW